MLDKLKTVLAVTLAWIDANPRKAALAGFCIGFAVKLVL